MNRAEVIERLLPRSPESAYLEIGVQHGYTFHAVKAAVKVAVDPQFAFDVASEQSKTENATCKYHQVTSDEYFSTIWSPTDLFDLIFIDGLHTFDQTLKDMLNAMSCLKPGGLIVLDDVMPVSYASSISDLSEFNRFREAAGVTDGSWMGDVYKVPFFLRSHLTFFDYATVLENCAQMAVWRTTSPKPVEAVMPVKAICALTYADFELGKSVLNLLPIEEIGRRISSARGW